jgi:multiple sugar transport system ATP-binding protein
MRTELKRLHRDVGATMLYVTHDQVEALTLGDRIAVMDSGRVRQVGTPDEVYGEPRDRFVGSFLGSPAMNFLDAEPASAFLPVPAGATVGIRPEHVRIGGDGVQAYVELVEVAGNDAFLHLANGMVARVGFAGRPAEGDWVNVSFAREEAHLFDAETGMRRPWA